MTERKVQVTVLFFAVARDLAGREQATLSLTADTRPEWLLSEIAQTFDGIGRIRDSVVLSLNQEYCEPDQQISLSPGDELAVIPPISGGIDVII